MAMAVLTKFACSHCRGRGHNALTCTEPEPPVSEPSAVTLTRTERRGMAKGPVVTYESLADVPAHCPRRGCTGLLIRRTPVGVLCSACAREFVVREVLLATAAVTGWR